MAIKLSPWDPPGPVCIVLGVQRGARVLASMVAVIFFLERLYHRNIRSCVQQAGYLGGGRYEPAHARTPKAA